ncbi:MAG TPA: ABC transporter substrate-binding protein [Methylomirabilota bacterium]|nr:ABC transporter substrate-binding protein [Methylomirabilota bacterium]
MAAVAGALAAGPRGAGAQPAGQPRRIGFLGNSTAALEANLIGPFREGFRELGYVEGRDLFIEYRWAEGDYGRFPELIAELAALKVEVIVTAGTPAAVAVRRTAPAIPLVMVAVGDPVGTGLVKSIGRPGGNLTGLVSIAPDLEGKRLELLTEVVPKLSYVAFLLNPANPFHMTSEKQARAAAKALHLRVGFFPVRAESEFERVFQDMSAQRPGAMVMLADRLFLHHRARIVEFTARTRLPTVYAYIELVQAGGLMSFGPSYPGMHRRAAYFVDRILKGANPADLPMELPAKFELVINLRTARALGLAIPQPILLRADELIE